MENDQLFRRLVDAGNEQIPAAWCVITSTSGSTPRQMSAKMLVIDDGSDFGKIEGSIGGGAFEHKIRRDAVAAIRNQQAIHIKVSLTHELAMCCGGSATVYIEPLGIAPTCIIFGAGHIAAQLCPLASSAGFRVIILDEREDLLEQSCFAGAHRRCQDYSIPSLDKLPFNQQSYIVVTTHSHDLDQKLVEAILPRQFRYAALIGSSRKAKMTAERCVAKGFDSAVINRLRCPAGLDIGAQTPAEIAVSVVAEMIKYKRGEYV